MNVKFPDICVGCQGPPDTTFHVDYGPLDTGKKETQIVWSDWITVKFGDPKLVSITENGSFEIPICSRCKNEFSSKETIFVISFIVTIFSGLFIVCIFLDSSFDLFGITKNSIIYFIILLIIGISGMIFVNRKFKPWISIYFIDTKNVEITNPEYAKKFAELNPHLNISTKGSVKKHES